MSQKVIRRFLALMTCVFSFSLVVSADIPKDKIDSLSENEKSSLSATIRITILTKNAGVNGQKYSDILEEDLSSYTIDELKEMESYLNSADDDNQNHLSITVCNDPFSSEQGASFSIYETVSDAGRQFGYVTQNNNPEIYFGDNYCSVSLARIYISYFAECTKEDAQKTLEGYTDELLYVLTETYPKITFDVISINWEVPAVSENNLYAASYWCESKDGKITRGDGTGDVYN